MTMKNERTAVYEAIDAERARQDAQWGGPAHDDDHSAYAWGHFVEYQLEALFVGMDSGGHEMGDEVRSRFVKIAALAVAAIESHDRHHAATVADAGGSPQHCIYCQNPWAVQAWRVNMERRDWLCASHFAELSAERAYVIERDLRQAPSLNANKEPGE